jgi:TolA-binding protein
MIAKCSHPTLVFVAIVVSGMIFYHEWMGMSTWMMGMFLIGVLITLGSVVSLSQRGLDINHKHKAPVALETVKMDSTLLDEAIDSTNFNFDEEEENRVKQLQQQNKTQLQQQEIKTLPQTDDNETVV